MTKKYPVIYEWAGKNFSGYAPDVAGCIATARTLPLMRSALKDALEAHLQWMKNDGDSIPAPSETVTVDMEPDKEFSQPQGYYVIVELLNVRVPESIGSELSLTGIKRTTTKRRAMQAA